MSTTHIAVFLKEYERKDKTRSLNLRVTHNRQFAWIPLNVFVTEDEWMAKEEKIDKKCKRYQSVERVNDYILKKKVEAKSIVNGLYDTTEIEGLTSTDIKNKILNTTKVITFEYYTNQLINELKTANRYGSAGAYEAALSFVIRNNDNKDLYFQNINYKFLKNLEMAHLAKGNTLNSLAVYMRTIRAIYNRAINENIAKRDWYPFAQYKIKKTKTQKRAISKTDVQQIENYKPKNRSHEFNARNYFMFSFYMVGLNFTDMAYLKKSNIINERLEYTRKKTKKFYSLALFDKPNQILKYYLKGKKANDYIFPIILRESIEEQRKDIKNKLKTYNKYIRLIASDLEIEGNITSYVARHSWASIGKFLNVPVQVISEGLGHDSIQTTQIYLESFEANVIDDATKLITG